MQLLKCQEKGKVVIKKVNKTQSVKLFFSVFG